MKNIILIFLLLSCASAEQKSRSISSVSKKQFCGKVEEMNSKFSKVEFQLPLEARVSEKMNVFVAKNLQKLINFLPPGAKLSKGDENGVLVGTKHSIHSNINSILSHHLMTIPLSTLENIGKSYVASDTNGFLCFSRDGEDSTVSTKEDTFNQ